MMSRSYYTNLVDLVTGNFPVMQENNRFHCRDFDNHGASHDRVIIVANQLPVIAKRRTDHEGWDFSWNEHSLLWQLKDGFPEDMEVLYVGSLRVDVVPDEQDDVSQILLEKFKCVPTFLPQDVLEKFYHGFCKKQLWPLLHYRLPLSSDVEGRFDRSMWQAYMSANLMFSQKIIEILNPDDDYVWIHDYHLMVLPTILRRRFNRLRIGFFLHSPFPSSEIYQTLPVREEILKALLNADLIGFHTFDYARHFLSCCSRMLGLNYQSKRGCICLEYYGRTIGIKIVPVGVHMGQIKSVMKQADTESKETELHRKFEGKLVLLGVDDMDIFKGIDLKLLAMEQLLKVYPWSQGKVVLVQIINPPRSKGADQEEIKTEIKKTCQRINQKYGQPGYEPVVIIDKPVSESEKIAYFKIARCVVVTALRDGMNLTPYEYVVCREGIPSNSDKCARKNSMLVLSEFIGCSPSLSGAIRVNPWNVKATAEAMRDAICMSGKEAQLRHEKHYGYVSTHDVGYWSKSFFQDLERACADHFRKRYFAFGLGSSFRVVALDPNFRKLSIDAIVKAYSGAKSRAILLDYDGTVKPQNSLYKNPSEEVIALLNTICEDEKNTVFIVSGRGRGSLGDWFSPCEKLGIAAEHGYYLRWSKNAEWETCGWSSDLGWMSITEPVMRLYTEATDGSSIETKESALVWKYRDADSSFGYAQALEMLDHLENVLANEPVAVKSGQFIVEVKPQGVSKGLVAGKIFTAMTRNDKQPDFVLCVGDDRSDEDMFEIIGDDTLSRNVLSEDTSVFACTVGQKPSKAKYYLDDTNDVIRMLSSLAQVSHVS